MQIEALLLGGFEALNDEEIELAGGANLRPGPINRAWEYWSVRLDKIEGTHAAKPGASTARGAARKKSTAKKSSRKAAKKRARRRR
jgi:hypothetical protein